MVLPIKTSHLWDNEQVILHKHKFVLVPGFTLGLVYSAVMMFSVLICGECCSLKLKVPHTQTPTSNMTINLNLFFTCSTAKMSAADMHRHRLYVLWCLQQGEDAGCGTNVN